MRHGRKDAGTSNSASSNNSASNSGTTPHAPEDAGLHAEGRVWTLPARTGDGGVATHSRRRCGGREHERALDTGQVRAGGSEPHQQHAVRLADAGFRPHGRSSVGLEHQEPVRLLLRRDPRGDLGALEQRPQASRRTGTHALVHALGRQVQHRALHLQGLHQLGREGAQRWGVGAGGNQCQGHQVGRRCTGPTEQLAVAGQLFVHLRRHK